jgi:acetyl esterase/lipase
VGVKARSAVAAESTVIPLWPEGVPGLKPNAGPEKDDGSGRFTNIHHPSLTVYAPPTGKANGTAVIYAAGGGYVRVAAGVNGGEVTKWLNGLGVTVFLLKYRHADYGQPAPLRDALRAVRIIRLRAKELGVEANKIGMLGGSAGGHLTASAGTMFNEPEGQTGAELDKVNGRPDFIVLIFPVITMLEPVTHGTTQKGLLGANPTDELKHRWSVEERVTKDASPTFLVHSSQDNTAPVENSLLFYTAMRKAKAPIEMHLYPVGPHGSGMDPRLGPTSEWPKHCESWMRFNGWLPKA